MLLRKANKQAKNDPWVLTGPLGDVGEAGVHKRTPQCDIVDAEGGTHCQKSTHARPASISIKRFSANHADPHISSPSIVYDQVSRCT